MGRSSFEYKNGDNEDNITKLSDSYWQATDDLKRISRKVSRLFKKINDLADHLRSAIKMKQTHQQNPVEFSEQMIAECEREIKRCDDKITRLQAKVMKLQQSQDKCDSEAKQCEAELVRLQPEGADGEVELVPEENVPEQLEEALQANNKCCIVM